MADPFIAEIRILPFSFAPRGWAWCDGQLLPISQNTALFSLLGTAYGGNGSTNFALPNLQGAAPMHPGDGPGLTPRTLGEMTGSATVTLLQSEMPAHTHALGASAEQATGRSPSAALPANEVGGIASYAPASGLVPMASQATTVSGGSQPHNNLQPYLTVRFHIALQGIYPARS